MNRIYIAVVVAAVAGIIFSIPLLSDNLANAGTIKKIQFTQTLTSSEDLGIGHSNEQLAMILSPNNGTLYEGTMTYTASEPVEVEVLHEINKGDSKGQPIWTVDNNTIYAETLLNPGSSGGTLNFAGSAIGIHSANSTQFTATVSFDGWIRGATPEYVGNATQLIPVNNLKFSRPEIPVTIPLHEGYYNGRTLYYIVTDSSDSTAASQISNWQDWKVQTAPLLAKAPQNSLTKVYVFTNGETGNGTEGFQDDVFSSTPASVNYTPVDLVINAKWAVGRAPAVLNSTTDILAANATGKLFLTNTGTILNMPQIIWPSGQMTIRSDNNLTDQNSYTGGQLLGIDNATYNSVTFVAHRGWGPDGRTIYYIVTSGTPGGPAKMMGVINTPALYSLQSVARDLYHFSNGITGAGPFGFQEGISGSQPGDASYSPICKISIISWSDGKNSALLENTNDIKFEESQGSIKVQPALAYDNNYMIDCPIIEVLTSSP